MTRSLIVGAGSIGLRHAAVLGGLQHEVAIVTRRTVELPGPSFPDIEVALNQFDPGYVVLARETTSHLADLGVLTELGYRGKVLVEKPLASHAIEMEEHRFERIAVGYNLRFHPLLLRVREEVASEPAITAMVYAGQHLSTWRPGRDYRQDYSADPARGGGVLRDLSHELDYIQWLFGPWRKVTAQGGRSGSLDIASDDHWAILAELASCPSIAIQLNYLDRIGQRVITATTAAITVTADLVRNTLVVNDRAESIEIDRNFTYRRQHTAMLEGIDAELLCSVDEARDTLSLIEAAERSRDARAWVGAS